MQEALIELAHDSRTLEDFQSRALEAVAERLGVSIGFFASTADASLTTLGLDSSALAKAFVPGSPYEADILPVKRSALLKRGVAIDTDVLGSSRVESAKYHRDFARPLGGRHSLFGYLTLRGRETGALMFGSRGKSFSERDVRFLESILPTLSLVQSSFAAVPFEDSPLPSRTPPKRSLLDLVRAAPAPAIASIPGNSSTISIRDRDGYREMVARSGEDEMVWTRASLRRPSESGWPYVDLFHLAAASASHRRRALFIGCGGGVALRQFARVYPGIRIDVVESEPVVISLAREHFGLDTIPGVTVHIGDGATFLERAVGSPWDITVIDAFDSVRLAAGFRTHALFRALREKTRPGGAIAINVIGALVGPGPVRDVVRAARRSFEQVRVVPVIEEREDCSPHDARNVVIVARRLRAEG